VRAHGAGWHVTQLDRTDFIELGGIAPDIHELHSPHIAAGERKLHAGVNVSVRRNIAGRVSGAARQLIHIVFARGERRSAKLLDVSADQRLVPENLS
jgi:hypothetical protein